jgi:hypothetical protein
LTLPILVQPKKKVVPSKAIQSTPGELNNPEQSTSHPSQQEIILQQQQSIFKSMLNES